MRPVYVSLGVGQEFNLGGLVKKIKVRQAIGPIVLKTSSETAPADLGETITFEKASSQVQVINAHDAPNTLELIVISSDEGSLDAASSSVSVNNLNEIASEPAAEYRGRTKKWGLYELTAFTSFNHYDIVGGNNRKIVSTIDDPNEWIESCVIDVVSGNATIIPFDINNGIETENMQANAYLTSFPKYKAGDKIEFTYRDRVDAIWVRHAEQATEPNLHVRGYYKKWRLKP